MVEKEEAREVVKHRLSARMKSEAVLRVLRGESLDVVARELGTTAAYVSEWRDQFIAHGTASLRRQESSTLEIENKRLKEKVGELTMDNEVLKELKRRTDPSDPFYIRRQKR